MIAPNGINVIFLQQPKARQQRPRSIFGTIFEAFPLAPKHNLYVIFDSIKKHLIVNVADILFEKGI